MTFEEIKTAILNFNVEDQKRLITDVIPLIWPNICSDESCLSKMREMIDEEMIKKYKEQMKN